MKTSADERNRYLREAQEVACQYVHDLGYQRIEGGSGGIREEADGGLVATIHYHARKGPETSRKTPVEELIVRVRIAGIGRKKPFRPALVTAE